MSDDIPDPWRSAAERKGISPTYRPLADRAGLSHETVRKVIQGRKTSNASIAKVAGALGVDVELVHRWRGEAPPDYGREFIPDQRSATLLTTEEREVINSLIRLLTDARQSEQKAGGEHDERSAPKTQAGESAAKRAIYEQLDRVLDEANEEGLDYEWMAKRLPREVERLTTHLRRMGVTPPLEDPEDYVLAASEADDDPEVESWQEEP